MEERLKILITNDDGYCAKGLLTLVKILKPYGDLLIVAPKKHQSGMSMAVSMGMQPIAVKYLGKKENESWYYVDGTPASCVKYGIDNIMYPERPDIIVSGINHGGNYATAALYSATVGAAMEGAVNKIPAIAVSVDNFSENADFDCVEAFFPQIFEKLTSNLEPCFGRFYNINFPDLPPEKVKGIKPGHMGIAHWEKEYQPYTLDVFTRKGAAGRFRQEAIDNAEPGEDLYIMVGDFTDDRANTPGADHRLVSEGYIAICAHNIDNTDRAEVERLESLF